LDCGEYSSGQELAQSSFAEVAVSRAQNHISNTVPWLHKNGVEQVELEPVPCEGGGAILVRGSVRNGDEFYILHTMLENRLTNPDLPARLVWHVGLASTNHQGKTKTR